MDRYKGEQDRLYSDKNCWQDVAFKAHLKIVHLQNELKKQAQEIKKLQTKYETEINELQCKHE